MIKAKFSFWLFLLYIVNMISTVGGLRKSSLFLEASSISIYERLFSTLMIYHLFDSSLLSKLKVYVQV